MSKNKLKLASVALITLTAPRLSRRALALKVTRAPLPAIGAAIAIGLAVLGGGLGQGRAAAARARRHQP